MHYTRALYAIFKGLQYCFGNTEIRKLAMWPWLTGVVFYILTLVGVYHLHPEILLWLIGEPSGFWMWLLYAIAWVLVGLVLNVASMFVTVLFVIIFTSAFQTAIAQKVLALLGREFPADETGVKGVVKEATRSVVVESAKLLWLGPFFILVLIAGFIPFLAPFALLINAWLLAYQFVDIVLDIYRLKSGKRLGFAAQNAPLLALFGLTLTMCWAIPFVGLLLPPAAVAGAAWLLSENNLVPPTEFVPQAPAAEA